MADASSSKKNNSVKYGVLGQSLPHTFSPMLHKMLGFEYQYDKIEKTLGELDGLFNSNEYAGFNVTVPYKKEAYERVTFVSSEAKATGSVNTVVFDDEGISYGDNTDVYGFKYMLKRAQIDPKDKECLVLGTGGASCAVEYALKDLGVKTVKICSRNGEINYDNYFAKASFTSLLVNATPVGMYPHIDEDLIDLSRLPKLEAVVDVIYNPFRTKMILKAIDLGLKVGNPIDMLAGQAFVADKIFLKKKLEKIEISEKDEEVINAASRKLEASTRNITLIGMPGSGKTTVGSLIAARTNREFVDLDDSYTKTFGSTPEEDIRLKSEDYFRDREAEIIRSVLHKSKLVVSCGGGAILRESNRQYIRSNSIVIYIDRPCEVLEDSNRPISKSVGVKELFRIREPLYKATCDIEIKLTKEDTPETTLDKVVEALKKEGIAI